MVGGATSEAATTPAVEISSSSFSFTCDLAAQFFIPHKIFQESSANTISVDPRALGTSQALRSACAVASSPT